MEGRVDPAVVDESMPDGDSEGIADERPDQDSDGDGIADSADLCPMQAETFNGIEDEDGCPDMGGIIRPLTAERFTDVVHFPDRSTEVPAEAWPVLDAIASSLRNSPELELVEIQAHTDERGSDETNLRTSQRQADAVKRFLADRGGVAPGRLRAVGYGERCPVQPEHTEAARQANRRVEFRIVRRQGGEGEDPLPCPAAVGISLGAE